VPEGFIIYTLPIVGALLGWFTNYVAIKMLFHPREPRKFLFWTIQGIFPKRQEKIASQIGMMVSQELFSIEDIKEQIADPKNIDGIAEKINSKIDAYFNTGFHGNFPLINTLIPQGVKEKIKGEIRKQIHNYAPSFINEYTENIGSKLDIETMISSKINGLEPKKLEELLLMVMKQELKFIEYVGAVIGFLIGLIQAGLIIAEQYWL